MVLIRTDLSRGGALPAWPGSWSHENNLFRPVSILRHIPGWEGRGSVSSRPSLGALRGMSLAPRARERQGAAGGRPCRVGWETPSQTVGAVLPATGLGGPRADPRGDLCRMGVSSLPSVELADLPL